jgi:hypothetical protein
MTVPMKAAPQGEIMEAVLLKGDIAKLTPDERVRYYSEVCRSLGLNPLTKPFEFIVLNGKMQLYALRTCADQLRKINNVSLQIVSRENTDGILTIHVRATLPDGRSDEDLGAVAFPDTLRGEARANAELKAITKAKRRATMSICGLGWLDETEIADIPASAKRPAAPAANVMTALHNEETGEVIEETSSRPSVDAAGSAASSASSAPQPPEQSDAADIPSPEEYVEKWRIIVDNASNAAHGEQMAKAWNAEKTLRNLILWPDDDTFAILRKKVTGAVKQLRTEPAHQEG